MHTAYHPGENGAVEEGEDQSVPEARQIQLLMLDQDLNDIKDDRRPDLEEDRHSDADWTEQFKPVRFCLEAFEIRFHSHFLLFRSTSSGSMISS